MCTALYVFIANSRISEILSLHKLKLAFIVMMIAMAAATAARLSGKARLTLIGRLYLVLTGLFVLSSFTGVWRGGSLDVLTDQWLRSMALFIAISFTAFTLRDVTAIVKAVIGGFFFLGVYTAVAGDAVNGRLSGGTSASDPNYIALAMICAIPMCLYLASRGGMFMKLTAYGAAAVMFGVFALTGSRGGLIGFGAVMLVWFFSASMAARMALVVAVVAITTIGLAVLPASITNRYTTMVVSGDANEEGIDGTALASSQSRQYLFKRSLELTGHNPLLGVGLGMFPVAENEFSRSTYGMRKGAWHATHNMYTEVSSENGIPALMVFIAILIVTLKNLTATYRVGWRSNIPAVRDAAALAYWLRLSLIGVMAAGAFLSIGYSAYIPILAAMTVVLHRFVFTSVASAAAPVGAVAAVRRQSSLS